MVKELDSILKNIPNSPGIYKFYSQGGDLLYIGKAKNLKKRVNSYFQSSRDHNQRISLMIGQIEKIEYTTVKSETESLLLEANLIHNLKPRYNVLLKDDKTHSFVKITNGEIPKIFITKNKTNSKNAQYYGPYVSKYGIEGVLRSLRIVFPFCQKTNKKTGACQYVSIKQCDGICCGKESVEDYNQKIDQIRNVLKGNTEKAEHFLSSKVNKSVENQNFALASFWRDRLKLLKNILSKENINQAIVLKKPDNIDIITLTQQKDVNDLEIGSIFVQNIRNGKLINVQNFLLSGSSEYDKNQFMSQFMKSYYNNSTSEDIKIIIQSFTLDQPDPR